MANKIRILSVILFFFLVVFEIALRVQYPDLLSLGEIIQPSSNQLLEYELKPGANLHYSGSKVRIPPSNIEISAQGLRDRVFILERQHNLRVAVLGDSFVFGQGLNNEDSIPKQLEKMLNGRAAESVEVMNCGVIGYNIEQEMEWLKIKVLPFHPDVIVMLIGPNDIYRKIVIPSNGLSNILFRVSYLYRNCYIWLNALRTRQDVSGARLALRKDKVVDSFGELPALLSQKQKFILVIKGYQPWMDGIVQFAKRNGYEVLDLSSDFSRQEDLFTIDKEDRHFNVRGAGFFAERISELLMGKENR